VDKRYTVCTSLEFAAAHVLHGYDGPCARLHGHNWRLEVEVVARDLDPVGMGMDFREIRAAANTIVEQLDHRHLNEIPPFDRVNPTAENIAAHVYARLTCMLDSDRAWVQSVTIWEADRSYVRYTERV